MRFERTITSISWIPSDALAGMAKLGTKMGVAHYDLPPPDHIGTDEALEELGSRTGSASPTACRPGSRSRTAGSSTTGTPAAA